MGLFSIYTGLVYNDLFSKSIKLVASSWVVNYNASTVADSKILQLDPKTSYLGFFPFGLDPVWSLASLNRIIYEDALKMKMAIIIGVSHMLFGLSLNFVNCCNFKDMVTVYTTIIPQIIFMLCIFAYLVSLILMKWILYSGTYYGLNSESCAPMILITFINMILQKTPEKTNECSPYMFPYQAIVQVMLVLVAVICIPWMLLVKPLHILYKRKMAAVKRIY